MRLSILLALLSICFWQCTPDPLEIDIPAEDPEIVVFSQVIPNALMSVVLTRTINSLEFSSDNGDTLNTNILENILVSGANVTVSYNGQTDSLFEIANGFYTSLFPLQIENEVYTLNIEADGKTLTSSSLMLPQIAFESVTPNIVRSDNDTLVTIDYAINDLPGDNWYMINFYKQATNSDTSVVNIDLNNFFERGTNIETRTVLLTDQLFENPLHSATIELPELNPTDSIFVTISNINETYYNFLGLRSSSESFFTNLTKEPINYPTNIENGLGFFNTHFPDIATFDLNEY